MREDENERKKIILVPIHSKPTHNREFQQNSKKMQKIKHRHYGFISSQNGTRQAENDTKKKLPFRSVPTRPGM